MTVSLHVDVTPQQLPADAVHDVQFRFVLRNDGKDTTTLHPNVAKLAAIGSFAGIGITWGISLHDAKDAALPIQELRRWYGPPGNPPSPQWAKEQGVVLAPGKEHVTTLGACWIPNALLEPRHLDPKAIDPEGMDNVAAPSKFPQHPALAERIPLARASVLVFGMNQAALDKARAQDDFLRGCVVAFITERGAHEVRVQYMQDSWMGVGSKLYLTAAPAHMHVG